MAPGADVTHVAGTDGEASTDLPAETAASADVPAETVVRAAGELSVVVWTRSPAARARREEGQDE